MHILLTRPIEDSKEMILKFKSLDHKISHIPLISIKKLNYDEVLNKNLQIMDATAIAFCRDNMLPIMVLNYSETDSILKAVCGESVGTLIK